jgi:hypothetical protein
MKSLIYVKWDNDKQWTFSIHGHFNKIGFNKPADHDDWDFGDNSALQQECVTKYALHLQAPIHLLPRFL